MDQTCKSCHKPVVADGLLGLCPECLIQAGFLTGAETDPGSVKSTFVPPGIEELKTLFPQLEILELIGRGGMGAVYKARQKELDRVVALKVLPPDIGHDAAFAERFTREAKALAKMNHPGIVTIYDFGRAEGLYFFLMEYVDGLNLRQLLASGRVSTREALAIVPQICDALQFAHDQGIVHRDIKPENILLDRLGRAKVADFGLAKIVGSENEPGSGGGVTVSASLTDMGKVMGTPSYMSPEQRECPGDVDHRADIYALGVVLYQMLTGELPGKRLEPPSKKVLIDVRLDEVVLRALEAKPELRYQQASVLKTQLETIAETGGGSGIVKGEENQRRLTSATTKQTTPLALTLVTSVFIVIGLWGLLAMVLGNGPYIVKINVGALALPLGIGLLRKREQWRRLTLFSIWACSLLMLLTLTWVCGKAVGGDFQNYNLVIEIFGYPMNHAGAVFTTSEGTPVFGAPVKNGVALFALFVFLSATLLVWSHWVLRRKDVRETFASTPHISLPWLEWSLVVFVFLVMASGQLGHSRLPTPETGIIRNPIALPTVVLHGVLTDVQTGLPVSDARVCSVLSNHNTAVIWTGSDGRFELGTWDEPQTIVVFSEGHRSKDVELRTNIQQLALAGEVKIELEPRTLVAAETKRPPIEVGKAMQQLREIKRLFDKASDQIGRKDYNVQSTLILLYNARNAYDWTVRDSDLELPFKFQPTVELSMNDSSLDRIRQRLDQFERDYPDVFGIREKRLEAMVKQTGKAPVDPGSFQIRLVAEAWQTNVPTETLLCHLTDPSGAKFSEPIRVMRDVLLDGQAVERAGWTTDPISGQSQILVGLNETGGRQLQQLTAANIKRRIAIVFQGQILSAPRIQGAIPGRQMCVSLDNFQELEGILIKLNQMHGLAEHLQFGPEQETILPFLDPLKLERAFLNLAANRLMTNSVGSSMTRAVHDWQRKNGADLEAKECRLCRARHNRQNAECRKMPSEVGISVQR